MLAAGLTWSLPVVTAIVGLNIAAILLTRDVRRNLLTDKTSPEPAPESSTTESGRTVARVAQTVLGPIARPDLREILTPLVVMGTSFGLLAIAIPSDAAAHGNIAYAGFITASISAGGLVGGLIHGAATLRGSLWRQALLSACFGVPALLLAFVRSPLLHALVLVIVGLSVTPLYINSFLPLRSAPEARAGRKRCRRSRSTSRDASPHHDRHDHLHRRSDAPGVLHLGADAGGVGVVEVGEDVKGVLPCGVGGVGVAGGVVGLAEAGEGGSFVEAVAQAAVQRQCPPVAVEGLGVVGEMVVDVAEAVPGVGLPFAVVERLQQAEGLLAVGDGQLVVPEQSVTPADGVEGLGLSAAVAAGLVMVEGLLGLGEGLAWPVLPLTQVGQVVVGLGFAEVVADLGVQVQRSPQVGVGGPVSAEHDAGAGEASPGVGLQNRSGEPVGGVERGLP
jgi:hypothetical protein